MDCKNQVRRIFHLLGLWCTGRNRYRYHHQPAFILNCIDLIHTPFQLLEIFRKMDKANNHLILISSTSGCKYLVRISGHPLMILNNLNNDCTYHQTTKLTSYHMYPLHTAFHHLMLYYKGHIICKFRHSVTSPLIRSDQIHILFHLIEFADSHRSLHTGR